MNGYTWKVALAEQLVQLGGSKCALDKNDHLVKLQAIQQLVKLSVLFRLAELDVVLLKTVQGELGFIIYVDLEWILHEFLADWSDVLSERSAEHHDLLLGRCSAEDVLNITSHVWSRSVFIRFVGRGNDLPI